MRGWWLSVGLTLAACHAEPARQPAPAASPSATAPIAAPDLAGRWTGVEGMFLDVQPSAGGHYRLTMQYDLDHRATADATWRDGALAFVRDGRTLTLRPSDGAATGLKYLAGKRDCLTVSPGEGYCRD